MSPRSFLILSALCAFGLNAQSLNQEIEVQHNVDVEHVEAGRLPIAPRLMLPSVNTAPLAFSDRTVSIAPSRDISFLEPMAFADTLATSPYAGYAAIGYFPVYNLGASAGYRILDNDHHRLNAWMQFDGCSYNDGKTLNPVNNRPYDESIHRNTVSAGLNYHLLVGRVSEFDAGIDYTFARFNAPATLSPGQLSAALYNQGVNRVGAQAQWVSAVEGLHYTAGVDYGYFGYADSPCFAPLDSNLPAGYDAGNPWRPVRENKFALNAAASLSLSDYSAAYLGVDFSFVANGHCSELREYPDGQFTFYLLPLGRYNHALLSLKPRYRLNAENFSLTVGAIVQGTFNSGKFFHIAPEVNVSWNPDAYFSVWARATGGEHQNFLSDLYNVNYMTAPMMAYSNSHIPFAAEGGFTAGPFRGAYARLYFGWAKANDWLMPVVAASDGYSLSMFRGMNLDAWKAGVELGFKYRRWVDFKAKGEMAPHSYTHSWYEWRDRARFVVSLDASSSPVDRLRVGVSYSLRTGRSIIDSAVHSSVGNIYMVENAIPLSNVSLLGVNASYELTERLSVFASVDNILNRRSQMLSLVPEQGLNGLLGVSYQF